MKKCLILANGKPPAKSIYNYLVKAGYNYLICADGGANSAFKLKILPNAIIGDLDSIRPEVLRYFTGKCLVKKISRQNDTDVEKCLKFAVSNRFEEAVLLGGTGDRLDHSFCNLGIVLKFFNKIKLGIYHEKTFLFAAAGKLEMKTQTGELISIYGINRLTKITSSGLKYPLKNVSLPFGERESTSNTAVGKKVILSIRNGKIFIIREFNNLKKNGFFFSS